MKTAFNGGGGGGAFNGGGSVRRQRQWTTDRRYRQRWRLSPLVVGGDSGRERLAVAMGEGGRWCMTVVMDDCYGSNGEWTISIQWP